MYLAILVGWLILNFNFFFLFFYLGKLCLVSGVFVMLHCT